MGQLVVVVVAVLWFVVIAFHISLYLKKGSEKTFDRPVLNPSLTHLGAWVDPNPWVTVTTTTTVTEEPRPVVASPPVSQQLNDITRDIQQLSALTEELEGHINAARFDAAAEVAKRIKQSRLLKAKAEVPTEEEGKTRFDLIG